MSAYWVYEARGVVANTLYVRWLAAPAGPVTWLEPPLLPSWLLTRTLSGRVGSSYVTTAGVPSKEMNTPDRLFDVYGLYVYPGLMRGGVMTIPASEYADESYTRPATGDAVRFRAYVRSIVPGTEVYTIVVSSRPLPPRVVARVGKYGSISLRLMVTSTVCRRGFTDYPYTGRPLPGAVKLVSFREEDVWSGGEGVILTYSMYGGVPDVLGVCG